MVIQHWEFIYLSPLGFKLLCFPRLLPRVTVFQGMVLEGWYHIVCLGFLLGFYIWYLGSLDKSVDKYFFKCRFPEEMFKMPICMSRAASLEMAHHFPSFPITHVHLINHFSLSVQLSYMLSILKISSNYFCCAFPAVIWILIFLLALNECCKALLRLNLTCLDIFGCGMQLAVMSCCFTQSSTWALDYKFFAPRTKS